MTPPAGSWLCAALLAACLTSFAWGMRRFFIQPAGVTGGMKLVRICGIVFACLHFAAILWPRSPSPAQFAGAAACYFASLSLFWWSVSANRHRPLSAIFSPDSPVHLQTRGPYALVRHPFYTSYLFTWGAGILASGNLPLILTLVTMSLLYFEAARAEESKFERGPLKAAYREYRSRTGFMLPNPFKALRRRAPEGP